MQYSTDKILLRNSRSDYLKNTLNPAGLFPIGADFALQAFPCDPSANQTYLKFESSLASGKTFTKTDPASPMKRNVIIKFFKKCY